MDDSGFTHVAIPFVFVSSFFDILLPVVCDVIAVYIIMISIVYVNYYDSQNAIANEIRTWRSMELIKKITNAAKIVNFGISIFFLIPLISRLVCISVKSSGQFQGRFLIPNNVPLSGLPGCNIISLTYGLRVRLYFSLPYFLIVR